MKIYTRAGDDGSTALFGGSQVLKCDARISAFGAVDELNATLGVVRSTELSAPLDDLVKLLQNQLFDLGAELASPEPGNRATELLQEKHVVHLEALIDRFEEGLPALKEFILPGGTPSAASLHVARCVCRRAEREIVALSQEATVRPTVLKYVNRVGDLLFVLARTANSERGIDDVKWEKST